MNLQLQHHSARTKGNGIDLVDHYYGVREHSIKCGFCKAFFSLCNFIAALKRRR
jgi:hypothetical protein